MSARVCGCDDEISWVSEECRALGYCRTAGEAMFGVVLPGEAVRASELQAADLREAVEEEQRARACEGCGRIWLHTLADGHGQQTQRQRDGYWWHISCYRRAQQRIKVKR